MTSEPAAAISSGIHALEARVTIENREISLILGKSESTVKKNVLAKSNAKCLA